MLALACSKVKLLQEVRTALQPGCCTGAKACVRKQPLQDRVCTVDHAGGQTDAETRSSRPVVTGPFVPPQLSRLSLCQTPSGGFWPPVMRDKDSVTSSGPDLDGRQIQLGLGSVLCSCMQASLHV